MAQNPWTKVVSTPCGVGGFYAASAIGAVAAGDIAGAGEIGEAGQAVRTAMKANQFVQGLDRAKWWLGAAGLAATVEGYTKQAWDWAKNKVSSGCKAIE